MIDSIYRLKHSSVILMSNHPVIHFEMPYKDRDRVAKFYEDAFGWTMAKTGPELGDYITASTAETDEAGLVKTPGAINGGFFPDVPEIQGPKVTRVIVSVADMLQAIKSVEAAGGKLNGEPVEIPGIGMWVNFTDSEGNLVGMLQPAPSQ